MQYYIIYIVARIVVKGFKHLCCLNIASHVLIKQMPTFKNFTHTKRHQIRFQLASHLISLAIRRTLVACQRSLRTRAITNNVYKPANYPKKDIELVHSTIKKI